MNMQMRGGCFCLFVTVAVVLLELTCAQGNHAWSGFVNTLQTSFDYQCPNGLAITGLASVFDDPIDDRRWEFACGSGGNVANVSSVCTLQSPIHILRDDIDYECPGNGYMSGFQTNYVSSDDDRLWSPYCCNRNYSTLINCHAPTSSWENSLEGALNWTTTSERVVTGMVSFYSAFNRDRRWRFKQCEIQVSCGDPGIPDNAIREGNSFLYEDSVRFTCNNGYYLYSGDSERVCQDTGLWSGIQPTCTLCTDIENCADIRCTTDADHYCFECESNHGVALGESAYRNLNTSCEAYCSWLGGFCYPGICPIGPSTCNCSSGFSGPDCLKIDTKPELESCSFTVSSLSSPTDCSINVTSVLYTNIQPNSITGNWRALFNGPSPAPQRPAYVEKYAVGISQTMIIVTVYRHDSYPIDAASVTEHECSTTDVSQDNPVSTLVSCTGSATASQLVNHTFLHGDWIKLEVLISNGGYLNITNLDTNDTSTHYYIGSPISPYSLLLLDTQPPTHCSLVPSRTCLANQDSPLGETLLHNDLTLVWGGWDDDPSGIKDYDLEIYKLIYDGDTETLVKAPSISFSGTVPNEGRSSYNREFSLVDQGPYSIVLSVRDNAGNEELSRRIVVYDDDSSLVEDSTLPLVVIGGFPESMGIGSGYWHNSTATPIAVTGVGHFYNTNLKTSNWLAPVANHTPPVTPTYDDTDRYGVPNALGITSLAYTYIADQVGGASPGATARPATFPHQTEDLALTSVGVSVPGLNDGDSVSIWFEANDFKNNPPAHEKVLVHVDSSPPVLGGLGLKRDGVDELLVLHGSRSLEDLVILFNARDEHSGLYEIEWSITTNSVIIAGGNIAITNYGRDACTIDPDCICDSVGHCHKTSYSFSPPSSSFLSSSTARHDTDYLIVVTATNHAQLLTSLTRQFTVDLTPPLTGSVFEVSEEEEEEGLLDIDYTSSYTITGRWTGFFDRETDILLYQYIISSECASRDSFQYPGTGLSLTNTNSTSVTWAVPSTGVYRLTVVAYNRAYLFSEPVCSDGLVVDGEGPRFEGVVIPGGVVREGLVRLAGGEVWLVSSERERSLVEGYDATCVNQSSLVSTDSLSTIPIRYNKSMPYTVSSQHCSLSLPFQDIIYTPLDTVLNISWSVADDNGIHDYQIGVASNDSGIPDILPMLSTGRHAHFSVHGDSFRSGESFHLILRATDVAGHEKTVRIGPIIIDTSPPVRNGSVSVSPPSVGERFYTIYWEEDGFYDDEDVFPLDRYEYAIGRSPYGTDTLPFTSLPPSAPPCSQASYCIAIATDDLAPGNQYHITLKVSNTGNLATYVPTDPFTVPFPLQDCLTVYEYDGTGCLDCSSSLFPQSFDADIIFNDDNDEYVNLTVSWRGLGDSHLEASFSVAVGTEAGLTDVVGLTPVPLGWNSYTFDGLLLESGTQYYTLVAASNAISTVNASSDGFLYLPLAEYNQLAFIWDGWSDRFDEDYQLSRTVVAAHWYYPDIVARHSSHYEWALFRVWGRDRSNLTLVEGYISTGGNEYGMKLIQLEPSTLYVSAVKACFKTGCLAPRFSDGFYLATPPATPTMSPVAEYRDGVLDVTWSPFNDPELLYYEWSIEGVRGGGGGERGLLRHWERLPSNTTRINLRLSLETSSSHQSTYHLILRGVNRAGLASTISSIIKREETEEEHTVYDIQASTGFPTTEEWSTQDFTSTSYTDLDYTSSPHTLTALWPSLRYRSYTYSVSNTPSFIECTSPYPIACNTTLSNGARVTDLNLVNGQVYYFCVRGLAEDSFSPSPSGPRTVTACSDGIVVDMAPPTGGCVQIVPVHSAEEVPELRSDERIVSSGSGGEEGRQDIATLSSLRTHSCTDRSGSQSSTSELKLVWDWFQDIEQYGNGPFAYGVSNYEYSIGTSPGSEDVMRFTSVGVVREVTVSGLSLTPGLTYYASIRATDQVGHKTTITSQGLVTDRTPPSFGRVWLNRLGTVALTTPDGLAPNWDLITDPESDIASIYWSLGSSEGLGDLVSWTRTNGTAGMLNLTLVDGQSIVLNVMAVNFAGLSFTRSSSVVYYDSSPPCPSRVFDGPRPHGGVGFLDLDYTSNHTHLMAHWVSFSDPHSGVGDYQWSIGSCRGCDDVMPFVSIGMVTDVIIKESFTHGGSYYVTVSGCSRFSGCTIAHSDGIIIDVTPPIMSSLHHGLTGSIQFQASRYTLWCHWNGFPGIHDSQSKLSHFTYHVGTFPGDSTYAMPTLLPGTAKSLVLSSPFLSSTLLPVNRTVYVTLFATNRAGLTSSVHSAGVFVSNVPPTLVGAPIINVEWAGSLVGGVQYTKSLLRFDWNFTDPYVSVAQYFWTLFSDVGTYQLVNGSHAYNSYYVTAANLDLRDGDRLRGVVRGCNQAGLCQTGFTNEFVLVDASPPVDGYFAVGSSSSAPLPWSIDDGMGWANDNDRSVLNLTFTGFSDPHSGISEYWATVGSGFGMRDLFDPSSPLTLREHSGEGRVSVATLQLSRSLVVDETVYMWVWSVNGAGRKSQVVQGTFRVGGVVGGASNDTGTLVLLRSQSCPIASCEGHCTCNERGHHCEQLPNSTCYQLDSSSLSSDMRLDITVFSQSNVSPLFTALTDKLSGYIQPVTGSPSYQWVEWSVGEATLEPGSGLIDTSSDPVWFPLASGSGRVIFDVTPRYPLVQGKTYSLRARVWYNETHYSIFTSEGALLDSVNPAITNGYRVREYSSNNPNIEMDYTQYKDHVLISWRNLYSRRYSGNYLEFHVGIGDSPSADNVYKLSTTGNVTAVNVTGLALKDARRYYVIIKGVTPLGLYAVSVSDGFIVDASPPIGGSVFIGGSPYYDAPAQSDRTSVSVRLVGFHDPHSFIRAYEVGIGKPSELIEDFVNVGINLSPRLTGLDLEVGGVYKVAVRAVNGAGVASSMAVYSSSFIIDTTPPVSLSNISYTAVLMESFETVGEDANHNVSHSLGVLGWELSGSASFITSAADLDHSALPHGTAALRLTGCIGREVSTTPGTRYILSFHVLISRGETVTYGVPCSYDASVSCTETISSPPLEPNISRSYTGSDWMHWERVKYSYITNGGIIINLCSRGDPVIIDGILLQRYSLTGAGAVSHNQLVIRSEDAYSSSLDSLYLQIFDLESGIKRISYALGTLPGGVQLQSYKHVSPHSPIVYPNLSSASIESNLTIFLTVLATNFAGLSAPLYSQPILLDWTSPVVRGGGAGIKEILVDGGSDVDYAHSSSVWVDWSNVVDDESGIKHCQWGLGSSPGLSDIYGLSVSRGSSANSTELSLSHGTTVYSIVSCINNAGHTSTFTSDGVTLLQDPPSHQLASLIILSPEPVEYETESGHIPTNSIQLVWNGFGSDYPLKYQVRIARGDMVAGLGEEEGWCDMGQIEQLVLKDMNISSGIEYEVQVRGYVVEGLWSQPRTGSFIVIPSPPVWNKGITLNATWVGNYRLTLEWSGVFSSPSPLTYEVLLGHQVGDTSFKRWAAPAQEVERERIVISNNRLSSSGQYFLAINALGRNGLYTTATYMVDQSIVEPINV